MNISNQGELQRGTIENIAALLPLMEQFGYGAIWPPPTKDVLSARFPDFPGFQVF